MTVGKTRLRVAVVGAGQWGKNIIRNMGEMGALAAVVDVDPARAAAAGSPWNAQAASFDQVLADPAIDAVAVVTPIKTHFALARAALLAGKHVFVEKAFTATLEEAEMLVALAERHSRVLMVGHLLRYHPAYLRARATIASGELGRLRYAYSNRLGFGRFRPGEDALWDLAAHDLSMLLDLAGDDPSQVEMVGVGLDFPGQSEFAHLHLSFPRGLRAHVLVSRVHPFKEHRLVLVADRGSLVFEDSSAESERKLVIYDRALPRHDSEAGVGTAPGKPLAFEAAEPLQAECAHFLRCVARGDAPVTDGAEALRVMRVLARAAAFAADSGQRAAQSPITA